MGTVKVYSIVYSEEIYKYGMGNGGIIPWGYSNKALQEAGFLQQSSDFFILALPERQPMLANPHLHNYIKGRRTYFGSSATLRPYKISSSRLFSR
jgi:hypothetical protein